MSNVVRLVNGGSIQVRTGVIQGIGPIGPTGPVGPPGNQGEQGPVGAQGPMGQIVHQATQTVVGAPVPITANTDQLMSWGSTSYDDLGLVTSTSNMVLPVSTGNPVDFMISIWICFADATSGYRDVWYTANGTTIARASRSATAGSACYANLQFPFRSLSGSETLQVAARSSATTTITAGAWTVTQIGSGPPGPQGLVGSQGIQGPPGLQGIQGVPGTAGGTYASYGALHT